MCVGCDECAKERYDAPLCEAAHDVAIPSERAE